LWQQSRNIKLPKAASKGIPAESNLAKLGQARTWKITIKALQAALKAMVAGFKHLTELAELPEVLQKQIDRLIKANNLQIPPAV
jgi:hypothetical protein